MHPDSPIMEVYNSSWRSGNFILTSTVGWRVRKSIGKSWNIHLEIPVSCDASLKCPFWKSVFHENSEWRNSTICLSMILASATNQDVVIFWYFTFSFEKATEREINVVLQLPLGPSVDSLAVPWIAAFPESHTNANVPVRKSLEIYLQFWNPWLSCSSKNAAICRVSKTSIAQILPPSPSQTHQVFQHLLCAGLRDLWPLHGKLKIRYWDGKVSTSDIPFHSVVNGKTNQQISGVQSETIY